MGCNHFICNLPSQSGCILSFPAAWLLFLQADSLFHVFLTNIVGEPPWAGYITSYTLSIKSSSSDWLMRFSKALGLIKCREEVIQTRAVLFFLSFVLRIKGNGYFLSYASSPTLFSPSFFSWGETEGIVCNYLLTYSVFSICA